MSERVSLLAAPLGRLCWFRYGFVFSDRFNECGSSVCSFLFVFCIYPFYTVYGLKVVFQLVPGEVGEVTPYGGAPFHLGGFFYPVG